VIARVLHHVFAAWLCVMLIVAPVAAVEPGEMLSDPALEARARGLSAGLRCLVCRNQSIDDSNSDLAKDLRIILRERIAAGDTDEMAVAYLVERYGNYILLNPPFTASTVLLWLGPGLFLLAALIGFRALWTGQRKATDPNEDLSDEDRALIAQTLAAKDAQ
jgi:cytochrome c-type biogenesis protein CcmH